MDNQRNLILAVVLSAALLFGWDFATGWLYPQPDKPANAPVAAASIAVPADSAEAPAGSSAASDAEPAINSRTRSREGGLTSADDIAIEKKDLAAELKLPDRVAIEAPEVAGSINPVGARIDDVTLKTHRQTVDKDSGPVRMFSPAGTPAQQFAQFGWVGDKGGIALPDAKTLWQTSGGPLAPDSPVTLTWDNGEGQTFRIRLHDRRPLHDHCRADDRQHFGHAGCRAALCLPQPHQQDRQPRHMERPFRPDRRVRRFGELRLGL